MNERALAQADGHSYPTHDTPASRIRNALQILYGADHLTGTATDVLVSRQEFDAVKRLLNETLGALTALSEIAKHPKYASDRRFLVEQLGGGR